MCSCAFSIATFTACDSPKSEDTNNTAKPDEDDGGDDSEADGNSDGETDGNVDGNTDGTVTELEGIFLESVDMPENKEYLVGDTLSFGLNFTDAVTVTGNPEITFYVGPTTTQQKTPVTATYTAGSGTKTLTFEYTVQGGHLSPFGLKLDDEPAIDLNGGTMTGADDVNLSLANFGNTKNLKIIEGLEDSDGAYRFYGGDVAASCTSYLKDQRYTDAGNGVYWLANPVEGQPNIKGVCDMNYEAGYGWLLVMNYAFDANSAASSPEVLTDSLPIIPDGVTLGDDLTADTAA